MLWEIYCPPSHSQRSQPRLLQRLNPHNPHITPRESSTAHLLQSASNLQRSVWPSSPLSTPRPPESALSSVHPPQPRPEKHLQTPQPTSPFSIPFELAHPPFSRFAFKPKILSSSPRCTPTIRARLASRYAMRASGGAVCCCFTAYMESSS